MKHTTAANLALQLGISHARGTEAIMKAQLIGAILKAAKELGLTHAEIARRAQVPRSAVTGILSGSLQKITLDRVLRLVDAVNLVAEIRIKKAA